MIGFLSTALVLAVTPFVDANGDFDRRGKRISHRNDGDYGCLYDRALRQYRHDQRVLDGGGDTLFDMYSLIVCMWFIAIPLALAGAFWLHWSPLTVYACTCLDEVGKIPWVMARFRKYKWVQDLTRSSF